MAKYQGKHVSTKVGPDGKPIERFYHLTDKLYGPAEPLTAEQKLLLDSKGKALFTLPVIATRGTVFFRRESQGWFATVARCSPRDNPRRETGRNVARRRYFSHRSMVQSNFSNIGNVPHGVPIFGPFDQPSYEAAKALYEAQ